MNETQWRPFDEECPFCGDEVEVFTSAGEDGMSFEGDDARCVGCGRLGWIDSDDGGDGEVAIAVVKWHGDY